MFRFELQFFFKKNYKAVWHVRFRENKTTKQLLPNFAGNEQLHSSYLAASVFRWQVKHLVSLARTLILFFWKGLDTSISARLSVQKSPCFVFIPKIIFSRLWRNTRGKKSFAFTGRNGTQNWCSVWLPPWPASDIIGRQKFLSWLYSVL